MTKEKLEKKGLFQGHSSIIVGQQFTNTKTNLTFVMRQKPVKLFLQNIKEETETFIGMKSFT